MSWNKGFTKKTHVSVRKISDTMRAKKLDNFSVWRNEMKQQGKIRSEYPPFKKDGDLAELMGVVLGDGHLSKFPRTEELSIFSNANNPGFISRYSALVEKIFNKKPALTPHSKTKCIRIRIYQKHISVRLGVPYSPRRRLIIAVPDWIFSNKQYIVRYLRGLYEAEGSHCIHVPTSTYKVFFTNYNTSMLDNVFKLVSHLGFHPHRSVHQIQISRKEEVFRFLELIEFRKY